MATIAKQEVRIPNQKFRSHHLLHPLAPSIFPMISDLRFALRSLVKTPGFTIIALLTLALGIGVNTSMFSIIDALLLRPAPYAQSDRLVQLMGRTRNGPLFFGRFSAQELGEIESHANGFAALTAYDRLRYTMTSPGQPAERLLAIGFTASFNETLRIKPLLGRVFTTDEFQAGKGNVVMLTESYWRTRFGGDLNVVGRTLHLNGEIVTIIGVVPAIAEYRLYWGNTALWRPLQFTPNQLNFRGYRQFWLIGRLKPDASPASIAAQLAPLALRQEKQFPQDYPSLRYEVAPLPEVAVDDVQRNMSLMLLGLSSFVLLIACANIANLQLARATTSLRQFSLRAALGASRGRLLAQQLTESVMLSFAGGGLGFLLALWLNSLAEHTILIDGAEAFSVTINNRILLATVIMSFLTGIASGLVPALLAARVNLVDALKSHSRGATAGRGQVRIRQALIVAEVALALVLLGGAAIINRGFDQMVQRDAGWETSRVLTAVLPIPERLYPLAEDRIGFFRKLEEHLTAIPGVEHAALATVLPLIGYTIDREIFLHAPNGSGGAINPVAGHAMVSSDYFAAMGIRLLEGRTFAPDVQPDGPEQIVVNESLARQLWPNQSVVGQRLGAINGGQPVWGEVIGVVRDVEPAASLEPSRTRFAVYRPLVQEPWSYVSIVLRAAPTFPKPELLAQPLRRAIADIDPNLGADFVASVPQVIAVAQSNIILVGRMLAGFALLGLVLAGVGLYGVISHSVAQRTSEFGIRLALGAQPGDILRHVLRNGARLTILGIALGLIGASGLAQVLASFMPRLAHVDVVGLLAVALLLFTVTLLACWLPARRATKVDPMVALRAE